MFGNIVKDLYIGKSKLDIRFNGQILEPETVVDFIGVPYPKTPKTQDYPTLPDFMVIGTFDNIKTFDMRTGYNTHYLLITGIPKGTKTLDWYRVKKAIWSSYYEDSYRGYLFQIQDATEKLELKAYRLENITA